jgi:hypothetical protein
MSRLLPCLVAVVLLGVPARAAAQQQAIFDNCATFSFDHHGDARPADDRIVFTGPVEITCDTTKVFADEVEIVEVDADTRLIYARGNVLFSQPDLRVTAASAEFNSRTRYGTFQDAAGFATIDVSRDEMSMFGTAEPHVHFWGRVIERVGPTRYRFEHGGFTTCGQPTPRWEIGGSSGTISLDERVLLRNAVLRVKNVPLLYVPLIYYPLSEDDRSTGFLIPTYSTSTIRGQGVSNAFFLVLGRSQDATFYHDWSSKSGQGLGGEYRYAAAPGSEGDARFYMLDESARFGADGETVERPARRTYDLRGTVNQALPRRFRLIGQVNYFTDITTRQLYEQNLYESSQRQRSFSATVSGNVRRLRLTSTVEQRDFFRSATSAQRHGSLPSLSVSLPPQPIGRSRVYVGANSQAAYLVSQFDIDDPATDRSLFRFDTSPTIRAPLSSLPFLSVTTNAGIRYTHWQLSLDPETQLPVDVPLSRLLLEAGATVTGPVFSRVFTPANTGYAERFKHLIEPSFSVSWLSPFDEIDRVVRIDGTDGLVGGTGTFTYGLTNTLLARRPSGGPGPGNIRDILTVRITQSYYTKAEAALYDYRNQSSAGTSPFSALRINVQAKPTDNLSADFNTEIDPEFRTPRQFGATGRYTLPRVQVNAGWARRQVIPGLPGYDDPRFATHLLTGGTSLRTRTNKYGGTYDFNFDVRNSTMLRQRIVAYYNAQCCGIQMDYQAVSYASFGLSSIPSDRRFGISFTLAGIGSFSNPFGSFGDNGGRR